MDYADNFLTLLQKAFSLHENFFFYIMYKLKAELKLTSRKINKRFANTSTFRVPIQLCYIGTLYTLCIM